MNTSGLPITALLADEISHHVERVTVWGIQRGPFKGCLRVFNKVHLHVCVVSTSPMLGDLKESLGKASQAGTRSESWQISWSTGLWIHLAQVVLLSKNEGEEVLALCLVWSLYYRHSFLSFCKTQGPGLKEHYHVKSRARHIRAPHLVLWSLQLQQIDTHLTCLRAAPK